MHGLLAIISVPTVAETLYLNAVGDGSDVPQGLLKSTVPTRTDLSNYDPSLDAFAGRFISKGGIGLAETNNRNYQIWLISAGGQVISGNITLTLWAAIKDFKNSSKKGSVTVYLAHCTSDGSSCTQIASSTITANPWSNTNTWVQITTILAVGGSYTIPSGRYLALKLIVDNNSDDDMWFAYDTTTYLGRIQGSAPAVTSINLASANPTTTASTVSWTVTFDKTVSGVDAADFSLVQSGGVSGASIGSVSGSGNSWTVTANAGSGSGSLGLSLVDNDTIKDSTNTALGGSGNGNGNFTGQVYTVNPALPAPLVEYRMDENSWSGVTGEINDSSANNLDGTAKGGATTAAGKICNAGTFNGSSNYAQVPDNTLLRLTGSYTIAAWVKTSVVSTNTIVSKNGSGSPWSGYEYAAGSSTSAGKQTAWLGSGSWLISNGTAVSNGSWHHLAVTVSGTSLQFYLDGVANGTVVTTSGASSYATSALYIGLNSDYTLGSRYFNGQMDELKFWNTALTVAQVQASYTNEASGKNWDGSTRTCPVVVSNIPANFNAFDTGTTANSTSGYIQTKIAGTAFSFDTVALTTAPSVLTSFVGSIKVELVDATSSSSCSAMTSVQTVSNSYTFQSSDSGRHTFSSVTQPQAYPNVKVRISYPATLSTTVACSSDAFALRPNSFVVEATDATWTTAGTARSLVASTASGTPTHKAGQPLTLTVTPYNSTGTLVTSTYNGSPVVSASCALPASNCVPATFSAGTFIMSSGIAISNTASYADVGTVSLSVSDASYAAIDANDGTLASQRTISSSSITVGRFVPDHFDATLNFPIFAPFCTTFTYIGQPVKYAVNPVATITAKNAAGAATQNYTLASGLFKINPSNATYGISPSYAEASKALTILNSTVPAAADSGGGVSTLTFADTTSNILGVTRGNPIAPFNAEIAMSFNLQDTDAVQVANINGVAAGNPVKFGITSPGNGIAFSGGYKTMRWGRLTLTNAHGSELTALPMPLFAEYYNGTAFVANTADSCTSLSLSSQITLSNSATGSGALKAGNTAMTILPFGTSSATLAHSQLLAGSAGLSFSAPGVGNTGSIDVSGSFSSLPWLLFDWDHDGAYDDSPTAKATFGIYRGNSQQIYLREVY